MYVQICRGTCQSRAVVYEKKTKQNPQMVWLDYYVAVSFLYNTVSTVLFQHSICISACQFSVKKRWSIGHKKQTTVDPVIEIDSHFASIQLTKPLIGMNHGTFPSGWQKQNKQETQMELSRYNGQNDPRAFFLSFLYVLMGVHIKFARPINQFLHIFRIVGWLILHWLMMYTYASWTSLQNVCFWQVLENILTAISDDIMGRV